MIINPIVRQIIDRDCHVSVSNLRVIRHVISRLRDKYQTFRNMPPAERKSLMRQCIQVHRENREVYDSVMKGRIS